MELNEQQEVRLEKVRAMRAEGIEPYPPQADRTHTSAEAIEHARALIAAFAAAGDPGVVGLYGQMYDRPHLRRAERLLQRARAAGIALS